VIWDLEVDESALNHRLAIGKVLSQRFGLSVDYTYLERFNVGSGAPAEDGTDGQVEANIHFIFESY